MKILSIVILIIAMCSVCSYACSSYKTTYSDSFRWSVSVDDTVRVAMINGEKVYYSAMSDKKDDYDPEMFTYIGYGYNYSTNGVKQGGRAMAHFYLKNNLTVDIDEE